MTNTSKQRERDAGHGLGQVTVRYWAAARAAAGRDTDSVAAGTLSEILAEVNKIHADNQRLRDVVAMCSILLEETPVSTADPDSVDVPAGSTLQLLPPFAGG